MLRINAANKSPITISGAFFATIAGTSPTGGKVTCRSMIYVSPDVKRCYLCYDTMLALGILNSDFPKVGVFSTYQLGSQVCDDSAVSTRSCVGTICGATKEDGGICDCPKRMPIPGRPDHLPFPCSPNNNSRMKAWLLDRYKASTFN